MQPINLLQMGIDTRPPIPQKTRQQRLHFYTLCLCKHETHWKSNIFLCSYAQPAVGTCVIHGLEGQSLLLGQGTRHFLGGGIVSMSVCIELPSVVTRKKTAHHQKTLLSR